MPLDRALGIMVTPHPDGGLSASLTMMVYRDEHIPSVEATLENVDLHEVTAKPADESMPGWISHVLRRLAVQVDLAYALNPDTPVHWVVPDQLPFNSQPTVE